MKIIKNKFFICILLLLTGVSGYCGNTPPQPAVTANSEEIPPGEIPPDLPINEHINVLVLMTLLFGFYIIYKHIQNKKASI
jgi:hypothetical protein